MTYVVLILAFLLPHDGMAELAQWQNGGRRLPVSRKFPQAKVPDSQQPIPQTNITGTAAAISSTTRLLALDVAAVVGDIDSDLTVAEALMTSSVGIPQCVFASSSTDFTQLRRYPYLFRTSSSVLSNVDALSHVVAHFKWRRISLVYTTDVTGLVGEKRVSQILKEKGVSVVKYQLQDYDDHNVEVDIDDRGGFHDFGSSLDEITKALKHGNTRIHVLVTARAHQVRILDQFRYPGAGPANMSFTSHQSFAFSCVEVIAQGYARVRTYYRPTWAAKYPNATERDEQLVKLRHGRRSGDLSVAALGAMNFETAGGNFTLNADGNPTSVHVSILSFQNGSSMTHGDWDGKVLTIERPIILSDGSNERNVLTEDELKPKLHSPFGIIMMVLCCMLMLCLIGTAIIVIVHRENIIIKSASPLFCVLELFGMFLPLIWVCIRLVTPTDGICRMGITLLVVGLTINVSALATKNYRIYRIFNSASRINHAVSNRYLLQVISIPVVLCLLPNLIHSILDYSEASRPKNGEMSYWVYCSSKNAELGWIIAMCIVPLLVIIFAVYLAFKTRNVARLWNEARAIASTIYIIALFAIVIIIVQNFPKYLYQVTYYVTLVSVFAVELLEYLILFGPKLHNLVLQRKGMHVAAGRESRELDQVLQDEMPANSNFPNGGAGRCASNSGGAPPSIQHNVFTAMVKHGSLGGESIVVQTSHPPPSLISSHRRPSDLEYDLTPLRDIRGDIYFATEGSSIDPKPLDSSRRFDRPWASSLTSADIGPLARRSDSDFTNSTRESMAWMASSSGSSNAGTDRVRPLSAYLSSPHEQLWSTHHPLSRSPRHSPKIVTDGPDACDTGHTGANTHSSSRWQDPDLCVTKIRVESASGEPSATSTATETGSGYSNSDPVPSASGSPRLADSSPAVSRPNSPHSRHSPRSPHRPSSHLAPLPNSSPRSPRYLTAQTASSIRLSHADRLFPASATTTPPTADSSRKSSVSSSFAASLDPKQQQYFRSINGSSIYNRQVMVEPIRDISPCDLHSTLVVKSIATESSMLSPHPALTMYSHRGSRYLTELSDSHEEEAAKTLNDAHRNADKVLPHMDEVQLVSLANGEFAASLPNKRLSGLRHSSSFPGHPLDVEPIQPDPPLISLPDRLKRDTTAVTHHLPQGGGRDDAHSRSFDRGRAGSGDSRFPPRSLKAKGRSGEGQMADREGHRVPSATNVAVSPEMHNQHAATSTRSRLKEIRMDSYTVVVPVQRQRWYILSVLAQWRMSRVIFVPRSKVLVIIDLETENAESLILHSIEEDRASSSSSQRQRLPENRRLQGEQSNGTSNSQRTNTVVSSTSNPDHGQVQEEGGCEVSGAAGGSSVVNIFKRQPTTDSNPTPMCLPNIPHGWNSTFHRRSLPSSQGQSDTSRSDITRINTMPVVGSQSTGINRSKLPTDVTIAVEPEPSTVDTAIAHPSAQEGSTPPTVPLKSSALETSAVASDGGLQRKDSTDSLTGLDDLRRGLPCANQIFQTSDENVDETLGQSQDQFVIKVISIHNHCWRVQLPDKKTMVRWLEIGQMVRRDNWITSHEQQQEEERQKQQQLLQDQRRLHRLQQRQQQEIEAHLEQQYQQLQKQREQIQRQEKQLRQQQEQQQEPQQQMREDRHGNIATSLFHRFRHSASSNNGLGIAQSSSAPQNLTNATFSPTPAYPQSGGGESVTKEDASTSMGVSSQGKSRRRRQSTAFGLILNRHPSRSRRREVHLGPVRSASTSTPAPAPIPTPTSPPHADAAQAAASLESSKIPDSDSKDLSQQPSLSLTEVTQCQNGPPLQEQQDNEGANLKPNIAPESSESDNDGGTSGASLAAPQDWDQARRGTETSGVTDSTTVLGDDDQQQQQQHEGRDDKEGIVVKVLATATTTTIVDVADGSWDSTAK
ncbi:hypothetical protein BGZ73_006128 [Actinomortierella ambigua]|nr:hypothetical protein BGZ73_006128 [Actinomortierella ambigua]